MTTSAISNQYKSVEGNYNVDYTLSKSSKVTNRSLFGDSDAAYSYENALETCNAFTSGLNLAKDNLSTNMGLFNSAQINYDYALSSEQMADQKLEMLFEGQTQNTVALVSNVAPTTAATIAATTTAAVATDGTMPFANTNADVVNQTLTEDQIKQLTDLQQQADLKAQYEKLENQHKIEIAQQEAERAQSYTKEQNTKLDNAEALVNSDQATVKIKDDLVQSSEKNVNNKRSILIEKQAEKSASVGSTLDLEM